LLGTNPFRWYDTQLAQGSAFPAVVAQIISSSKTYNVAGRMTNGNSRVQFTIWSTNTGSGMTARANVESALATFLDGLNLIGIPGLLQYPNYIVGARDGWVALPQPGNPLKLIDAMVFSNDSL